MFDTTHTTHDLTSIYSDSLYSLERHFLINRDWITEWFIHQWQLTPPPVYGSVDLRNAGFKLAPIDMNLFPAGFNNLNPAFLSLSVSAAKKIITRIDASIKNILIIPESHTRNLRYWDNMATLQLILTEAGFNVRLGSMDTTEEVMTFDLSSGIKLHVDKLIREANNIHVEGFSPDIILLNNDLSEGIPDILQNTSQLIMPPAELGWSQRLKSEHFQYYAEVVNEFAREIKIDPWLIAPLFRHCGHVDFMQQDGMECVIHNAEVLFEEIKNKYQQYQIPHAPFLIIKADAGTYGMAVMTLRDVNELKSMNRKQRTRMSKIKGGQPVNRVIIQEGIYTFETFGPQKAVAEPVMYLWGDCVVGGFYRVHQDRGVDENLNSPGMQFEPLPFQYPCDQPNEQSAPGACPNRFFVYGIIAKLSMLAAAREIKDQA